MYSGPCNQKPNLHSSSFVTGTPLETISAGFIFVFTYFQLSGFVVSRIFTTRFVINVPERELVAFNQLNATWVVIFGSDSLVQNLFYLGS